MSLPDRVVDDVGSNSRHVETDQQLYSEATEGGTEGIIWLLRQSGQIMKGLQALMIFSVGIAISLHTTPAYYVQSS